MRRIYPVGSIALLEAIVATACHPIQFGDDAPSSGGIGVPVTDDGEILLVGRFCFVLADSILIYGPGDDFSDEPVTELRSPTKTSGDYAISLNTPDQFGFELVRGTWPNLDKPFLPARILFSDGEDGPGEWVTIEELPPAGYVTFADGSYSETQTISGTVIPSDSLCTPEK